MSREVNFYVKILIISTLSLINTAGALNLNNLNISELIKNGMDLNVNPCDDFYSYVCGSWKPKLVNIPWIAKRISQNKINILAKEILSKPLNNEDGDQLQKEKKWLKACTDAEKIQDGFEIFQKIINENGGWPTTNNSISWQEVDKSYARRIGDSAFFDIELYYDFVLTISKPSRKNIIQNSKVNENNIDKRERYINNILDGFLTATNSKSQESTAKASKQMVQFQEKMQKIIARPSKKNIKLPISKLQKKFNQILPECDSKKIIWHTFFQSLFVNTAINVTSNQLVRIDIEYLKELYNLLCKTENHVIVNYIHLAFAKEDRSYYYWHPKFLSSYSNQIRFEKCIKAMPLEEGYLTKAVISQSSIQKIEHVRVLFEEIKKELGSEILHSWLEEKTKKLSVDKLENVRLVIGNLYPHLSLERKSYDFKIDSIPFENWLRFKKAQIVNIAANLKEHQNKYRSKRSLSFNAFYSHDLQTVDIVAGLLLHPLFDITAPQAINYGSLGFAIGHELSHGFDTLGIQFDNNGKKTCPWTEIMNQTYEKKAECFKKQFKNSGVNESITLQENIADAVGLKIAFNAYKRFIEQNQIEEQELPGLESLKGDTLFFVSFAASFCVNQADGNMESVHSPFALRVNMAVSNLKGFAKAFECEAYNLLIKNKKCDLWFNE